VSFKDGRHTWNTFLKSGSQQFVESEAAKSYRDSSRVPDHIRCRPADFIFARITNQSNLNMRLQESLGEANI
jgi:hypothetical protein